MDKKEVSVRFSVTFVAVEFAYINVYLEEESQVMKITFPKLSSTATLRPNVNFCLMCNFILVFMRQISSSLDILYNDLRVLLGVYVARKIV